MCKKLIGVDIGSYTFDASARETTINGIDNQLRIEQILGIINVKNGHNTHIYSPIEDGFGGAISNNVITLDYDTSVDMADTDSLQIWVNLCDQLHPQIIDFPDRSKDTFGHTVITEPKTIFDNTFINDDNQEDWEIITSGGGNVTYLPNESSISLNVGTALGDKVIAVQHGYNFYLAGKTLKASITGNVHELDTYRRFRFGYFDDRNGVFFEISGNTPSVVIRSYVTGSPVDNVVNQDSWNVDTLDGSGGFSNPSGITYDKAKHYLAVIISGWQGGNKTAFGFDIGGTYYIVHVFHHSNINDTVFCETFTLPVRYEVENIEVCTNPGSHVATCQSVQIYGGYDIKGKHFATPTMSVARTILARQSIVSIRCSQSFGSGPKVPRALINALGVSTLVSTSNIYWELIYQRGHLGESNLGGSPTWNSIPGSVVEYSVDGTTVTGGILVDSDGANSGGPSGKSELINTGSERDSVRNVSLDDAGTQSDYLHLVATPIGVSSIVRGVIKYNEYK